MAGMLPGVECARRRRFHGDSDSQISAISTRRSFFCLYSSSRETHLSSSSQLIPKFNGKQERGALGDDDEALGDTAREAKERLDERLGSQRKSSSRTKSEEGMRRNDNKGISSEVVVVDIGVVQTEVYREKKSGPKKLWGRAKLTPKASKQQEECAVCLEHFEPGETLAHLPCAHRFHCRCLAPWLQNHNHCPCCRMDINYIYSAPSETGSLLLQG